MLFTIIGLLICLTIILISCELFTNGVEWLGKMLKLGDGVVGSIFSAVGTCLPETMIPIIAILFSKNEADDIAVGIGAILGAPFMLSTLGFFVTGISVLLFWNRRKAGMQMLVDSSILRRDIGFFIIVYTLGISAAFVGSGGMKSFIAGALVLLYIGYIILTVKKDHQSQGSISPLYMTTYLNVPANRWSIMVQLLVALLGIILGAELFVGNIEDASHLFGIPPLVLSLILTPIATELPEKFNSVLWIARRKDTLALGNITGAMVFQSCIPVAIGISATAWKLDAYALLSSMIAIASAALTYLFLIRKKKLTPVPLLAGGAFYALFLILFLKKCL